jgi:hypothetical protein
VRRDEDDHASSNKDDRNHYSVSYVWYRTAFRNPIDIGISAFLEALSNIRGESERRPASEYIEINTIVLRPDYHAQSISLTRLSRICTADNDNIVVDEGQQQRQSRNVGKKRHALFRV